MIIWLKLNFHAVDNYEEIDQSGTYQRHRAWYIGREKTF